MQFFIHGGLTAEVGVAMQRQGHRIHDASEFTVEEPMPQSPAEFLAELTRRQWCLLTDDRDFIHGVYEQGLKYPLCMVLLLVGNDALAASVDRLFERYKRLSPRRLYTVTAGRVKVRQLPG